MRAPRPSRSRPAQASRIASSCAFLEAAQARVDVAAQQLEPAGRAARAAAGPGGAGSTCRRARRRGRSAKRWWRSDRNASCGLARGSTAVMQKPGGSSLGTSFIECTAMSARPSCIATSSSLTNRPLPPTSASARSCTRSPCVLIGTSSTGSAGWAARSSAATCSACQRASWLRRVAMRSGLDKAVSLRVGRP